VKRLLFPDLLYEIYHLL